MHLSHQLFTVAMLKATMGLALSIIPSAACAQNGWPSPEPLLGTIPNNPTAQTLDPALIRRSDGKLFLYTTAKNGSVWTASSLHGPWTHEGVAELRENGGAPSIHQVGDTYFLYINNHEFDYGSVGETDPDIRKWFHNSSVLAASSRTLEVGSWTQHGRLEIDWAKRYNILDAALLTVEAEDGGTGKRQHLLSFGSYQQGIFQIPLADPPTRVAEGANEEITQLANNRTNSRLFSTGPTEASYVFRWKEWYYMFFSSGRCCKQQDGTWLGAGDVYKVMVCRSKDPRGGFVDDEGVDCAKENGGKEILGSHDDIWAPGGQGVMVDEEAGGPIIYYHYGEFSSF